MDNVAVLMDMGFDRESAQLALQLKHNNLSAAADYLINHPPAAEGPKIKAPAGQWSCPSCTYFNDDKYPTCYICGTPRALHAPMEFGKPSDPIMIDDDDDDDDDGGYDDDDVAIDTTKAAGKKMAKAKKSKSKSIFDSFSKGFFGTKPKGSPDGKPDAKKTKQSSEVDELAEKQRKLIKRFQDAHAKEFDALKKVFLSPACCTDSKAEHSSSPPPILLNSAQITALLKKYVPNVTSMRDRRNMSCIIDFIVSSYFNGLPFYDSVPAVKQHIKNALQCIFDFANDPSKSETEKKRHLMRLADAFTSCQAEQGRVIDTIYGMITGRTKGLRDQILALVDEQKMRVMDTVIVEIHPEAAQKTLVSSVQFPHLESSYIHAVGRQLGMRGVEGSGVDRNITMLSKGECKDVLQRFHRLFSVFEVIQTFVDDVNQQDEDNDRLISRDDLLRWAGDESVNRGFDKFSIFYDESRDPSEYNDAKPKEENEYQPFLTREVALDIFNKIFISK